MNKTGLILFLSLATIAATYLLLTKSTERAPYSVENEASQSTNNELLPVQSTDILKSNDSGSSQHNDWSSLVLSRLREHLTAGNFQQAIALINQNYEQALSTDLDRFKATVIAHAAYLAANEAPTSVIQLLREYTHSYDDLDAWRMLATAYISNRDWVDAVRVLAHSTTLENDFDRYANSLNALETAASQMRSQLAAQNDSIGVLALYRRLFEQYPQHPRFQLELARALVATGDLVSARTQLEPLLYEPDLGSVVAQEIAAIDEQLSAVFKKREQRNAVTQTGSNQIVVPLIRAGNSLLVDTQLDGQKARLLLDTGASITAFSSALIAQLSLRETGQTVRLSTANGVTTARLFKADRLDIGRITFSDLIVAEIDLPYDGQISGLLGTDVLGRMSDRYSYVIDDQQNALIFKSK